MTKMTEMTEMTKIAKMTERDDMMKAASQMIDCMVYFHFWNIVFIKSAKR